MVADQTRIFTYLALVVIVNVKTCLTSSALSWRITYHTILGTGRALVLFSQIERSYAFSTVTFRGTLIAVLRTRDALICGLVQSESYEAGIAHIVRTVSTSKCAGIAVIPQVIFVLLEVETNWTLLTCRQIEVFKLRVDWRHWAASVTSKGAPDTDWHWVYRNEGVPLKTFNAFVIARASNAVVITWLAVAFIVYSKSISTDQTLASLNVAYWTSVRTRSHDDIPWEIGDIVARGGLGLPDNPENEQQVFQFH